MEQNHNVVRLNDQGIIEVTVVGDQTVASVAAMGKEIESLLLERRDQKLPVLILDDITKIKNVESDARKMVVDLAKQFDYDKLAMYGRPGLLQVGANLMLAATGQGQKVKYFSNLPAALDWLQQK